jgi:hypothetical protein
MEYFRVMEDRNIPREIKRKANWIGHILHTKCLLKHTIGEKPERWIEVTGRQEKICKQLLDDLKEMRGYRNLKVEALDCTLWRTYLEEATELL